MELEKEREEMSERKKYHLINELPHIYELEDMMAFCGRYQHLYIYGCAENQQYLLKYFDMCGVDIDGFTVSFSPESFTCIYRELPVKLINDVISIPDTGVIVGLADKYYDYVIPFFREHHFDAYFLMSEYNKRSIAWQMRPRPREELTFEFSLADHCNIACQMCDHYAQVSDKYFPDFSIFEKDIIQMGKIFDHQIAAISFLGGEPTLNNEIVRYLRVTRREFPEAEIIILTNGIKLLELEHSPFGNLWEECRKLGVHITVTVYPIKIDYAAIEKKAEEYGVPLAMSSDIHAQNLTTIVKTSDKHTMDLSGSVPKFYCVNCLYFNKFNVLKDGKLYMCPIEAHIDIFNHAFKQNLKIREGDYLDIYKVKDWHEIAEFTSNYVPFCSYCDLKHWGHYGPWHTSTKQLEEYVGQKKK